MVELSPGRHVGVQALFGDRLSIPAFQLCGVTVRFGNKAAANSEVWLCLEILCFPRHGQVGTSQEEEVTGPVPCPKRHHNMTLMAPKLHTPGPQMLPVGSLTPALLSLKTASAGVCTQLQNSCLLC